MDKNRKKRTLGILRLTVLNGAFLLLCLVALVPVLYALTLSFSGSGAALSSRFSFWPTQPTLENYRAILFDEPFLSSDLKFARLLPVPPVLRRAPPADGGLRLFPLAVCRPAVYIEAAAGAQCLPADLVDVRPLPGA